ncbi:MAG: hypothetical protein K1000chlam2_01709 [Chlamydiae bacterium]|nr:hypothetical protein [Chlamydiota bacterium]
MVKINLSTHSPMASSRMANEVKSVASKFSADSLSPKMKEFGGEKPSLISRMYQSVKNFFCSVWNFIFGVKVKVKVEHDSGEAYDKLNAMMKELGEHTWYEVHIKCGEAVLNTFKEKEEIKSWFEGLDGKDRLGELSIVVCPMDTDPGILKDGINVGDRIKKYSSETGECEFTVEKNIETFEAVQQAKTYEERQEILSKL